MEILKVYVEETSMEMSIPLYHFWSQNTNYALYSKNELQPSTCMYMYMYDTSLKFCNFEGKATFLEGKFF